MSIDKSGAQTVNRACAMLKAIAGACPEGMRGTEVADRMELPRATAYRVLAALQGNGMIELNGSGRYVLGPDMFLMGLQAQNMDNLRDVARASLLRLSAATGDTAFLLLRHGFDAICVDRVDGNYPIKHPACGISERLALGRIPGGMAILAMLPQAEQDEIIRHNLHVIVNDEMSDEVAIRCAIEETRQKQYALNIGKRMSDLAGIAVAVNNPLGRPIGAISIGGIVERFSSNRIPMILQLIRQEAAKIGGKLNINDDRVPDLVS